MYETADCRQLKYQIEELIRREKLTKWVVHEVKRHKSQGVGYHEVPPPRNRKLSPLQGAQETKVVMLLLGDHILGEIATSVWRCTFTRLRDFLSIMFITCRIAPPQNFKEEKCRYHVHRRGCKVGSPSSLRCLSGQNLNWNQQNLSGPRG